MKNKILLSCFGLFCLFKVFPLYSYGYLDPSAMTYIIQVTAAIVITITTSIGIFFYKIKRFLKKKKEEKNSKGEESEK